MKSKIVLPPEVKSFFMKCGVQGGSKTSPKKLKSSRKNGASPCHPGKRRGRPFGSKKKSALNNGHGIQSVHE